MKRYAVQQSPTTAPMQLVDENSGRNCILIRNAGAVRCYLDRDTTVSTSSVLYLDPAESLNSNDQDAYWAVAASGTGDLRIVEVF